MTGEVWFEVHWRSASGVEYKPRYDTKKKALEAAALLEPGSHVDRIVRVEVIQ